MRRIGRSTLSFRTAWLAFGALLCFLLGGGRVAAAPATPPVDVLLARTASFTARFLEDFSSIKCTERVSQAKLGKSGKVEYKEEASFDYLLLAQPGGGDLTLVESRLPGEAPKHTRNLPLLVTNGFSTLLLVFHPSYQASFEFEVLGDEVEDGHRSVRVHFRHIKGRRSTAVLLLRGREYPLDLEGTAWVDPETGVVARIAAGLEAELEDVGMRALRCEVQYQRVSFAGLNWSAGLPSSAVVEVETPRQHWRNVDHFTEYERFSTSVESRITGN